MIFFKEQEKGSDQQTLLSNKVIDGHQSFVWEQANNRMYVQQAILSYIFNKK